jgi:hypothetical protein
MKTFTTQEASQIIGLSSSCIATRIRKGYIKAIKVQCAQNTKPRYLISESEVERVRLSGNVFDEEVKIKNIGHTFNSCGRDYLPHSLLSKKDE